MVEYEQIIKGLNIKPPIGFFGYSSVTLIKDGNENILCDTGGLGVRKYILELKNRVEIHKVFLSHLHFDHCANVSLFKNIPIYIHKDEVDELDKNTDNIYSDMNSFIKESIKSLNIILFSKEDKYGRGWLPALLPAIRIIQGLRNDWCGIFSKLSHSFGHARD